MYTKIAQFMEGGGGALLPQPVQCQLAIVTGPKMLPSYSNAPR